jgi:hypothetical protein
MPTFHKVATIVLAVAFIGVHASDSYAQMASFQQPRASSLPNFDSYRIVPKTVYKRQPKTASRWVNETDYQTQKVTSYEPAYTTETRYRETKTRKPVTKTRMVTRERTIKQPITETKYRERIVETESYENVTEMRDKEFEVRKAVTRTEMRDEKVTVRKEVVQNLVEVERTTTYRPVTVPETSLVPADVAVNQLYSVPDPSRRPRLQALAPGYYTDPATGQSVYRRRGLHWVQPSVSVQAAGTVPGLVAQPSERTTYVPETNEKRTPVEVKRYVDRIETRKVPVEVETMVVETETRKVPVTVRKPKIERTIEKVPYTETRYVDKVITEEVPVTETTYETTTDREPYEVEVASWKTVTKEVQVPKTVRRRVDYQTTRDIPHTIMMKIPIDCYGNAIGPATPVDESIQLIRGTSSQETNFPPASTTTRYFESVNNGFANSETSTNSGQLFGEKLSSRQTSGYGSTQTRNLPNESPANFAPKLADPATKSEGPFNAQLKPIEKTLDETSERKSILELSDEGVNGVQDANSIGNLKTRNPDQASSDSSGGSAGSSVPKANLPTDTSSETGDESADLRVTSGN